MSDEQLAIERHEDTSGGRAIDAAAREGEARLRQFGEHAADTLWIIDAASGRLDYLSPAFERIWGESRERIMADLSRWRELVHPDDRAVAGEALSRLLAGEPVTSEYRIVRADGGVRWIRDVGFAIRDEDGRIARVAGIAHDFTDRRAIEDALRESDRRQRTLLGELQHRVRNNLAVVRSITRRTAEASDTAEDLAAHLDGRIGALSRAQAEATRDPERGMDLRALIDDELLAAAIVEHERVRVDGPNVRLRHKAGETLTLAMHELVTNSLKFGALSDDGALSITWRVHGDRLALDWSERLREADPARVPRRGFGTEMLDQTLPYELGADVAFEVGASTVRCGIRLPLQHLIG